MGKYAILLGDMSKKHQIEKAKATLLIAIFFILAALSSCKPVEYKELTAPSIDSSLSMSLSGVDDGTNIYITIPAVSTARSYGYTFGSSSAPIAAQAEFSNGTYVIIIPNGFYSEDGAVAEVRIWASPYSDPSSVVNPGWVNIGTVGTIADAPDISVQPEGFVSERHEDSVLIIMHDEPVPSRMEYRVEYEDGSPADFEYDLNEITVSGLEANETYNICIYHAYKTADSSESEFGDNPLSLEIPAYDPSVTLDIKETSDGKGIEIVGAPGNLSNIKLKNLDTGNSYDMDGNVFSFTAFDSGSFRIEAKDGSQTVRSNIIYYTTPLEDFIENGKEGRQHYWFDIRVADESFANNLTAFVLGGDEVKGVYDNGVVSFTISDLSSASPYTLSVRYGNTASFLTEIGTLSFEGRYMFDGDAYTANRNTPSPFNFTVDVVENETPNTPYKYLIYAVDSGIEPETVRISPLYSPELGDHSSTMPIQYKGDTSYQKAYQWNNTKWNSLAASSPLFIPTSWSVSGGSALEIDRYRYLVESIAFGMPTTTETIFSFSENDDRSTPELLLIFYNKIQGDDGDFIVSTGNGALWKNAEGSDPYTFTLVYQGKEN